MFYSEFPLISRDLKLLHPTDKCKCLFLETLNFPSGSFSLGNLHVPGMEVYSGSKRTLMNARVWIFMNKVKIMNLLMNLETQLIHILGPTYMLSWKFDRLKNNPFFSIILYPLK